MIVTAADNQHRSSTVDKKTVLSDRERAILAFEAISRQHAGLKEQAIRDEFGLSAARYYQILAALLDSPAALAHDPMLVKRLQRVRDSRAAARTARLLSHDN